MAHNSATNCKSMFPKIKFHSFNLEMMMMMMYTMMMTLVTNDFFEAPSKYCCSTKNFQNIPSYFQAFAQNELKIFCKHFAARLEPSVGRANRAVPPQRQVIRSSTQSPLSD